MPARRNFLFEKGSGSNVSTGDSQFEAPLVIQAAVGRAEPRPERATWEGPAGRPSRPGRAGLGQVRSGLARLGPVVYSGAGVLPVVYQWFTSGLLQWFTRVLIVFGGTLELFLERTI